MGTSIAVKPKKRGRPATGRDPLIGFRAPPEMSASLDKVIADWADADTRPSRSELIRMIVTQWLKDNT